MRSAKESLDPDKTHSDSEYKSQWLSPSSSVALVIVQSRTSSPIWSNCTPAEAPATAADGCAVVSASRPDALWMPWSLADAVTSLSGLAWRTNRPAHAYGRLCVPPNRRTTRNHSFCGVPGRREAVTPALLSGGHYFWLYSLGVAFVTGRHPSPASASTWRRPVRHRCRHSAIMTREITPDTQLQQPQQQQPDWRPSTPQKSNGHRQATTTTTTSNLTQAVVDTGFCKRKTRRFRAPAGPWAVPLVRVKGKAPVIRKSGDSLKLLHYTASFHVTWLKIVGFWPTSAADHCDRLMSWHYWCLMSCLHKNNTNASRRQEFSVVGPCFWNSLSVTLCDRDISLVQFNSLTNLRI